MLYYTIRCEVAAAVAAAVAVVFTDEDEGYEGKRKRRRKTGQWMNGEYWLTVNSLQVQLCDGEL